MELVQFIVKLYGLFWSMWPKSFWFFIFSSAFAEAASMSMFRLGSNRGGLAVVGYILGFFALAFGAEGLKYSTLSLYYPIWIGAVATLISISALFIFHDPFSLRWFIGFILTIIGVTIIQTGIPES